MQRTLAIAAALFLALSGAGVGYAQTNGQICQPGTMTNPDMNMSTGAECGAGPATTDQTTNPSISGQNTGAQNQPACNMGTMGGAYQPGVNLGQGPGVMGAGPSGMMCQCQMGTVAVDDTYVYVLRGNELLKLNKSNLQFVGSTMLPPAPATTTAPATPAETGGGPAYVPTTGPGVVPSNPMSMRSSTRMLLDNMNQMTPHNMEMTYLQTVIRSHAGAIAWSQLAETKASHAELQQFARHIISDETGMNRQFAAWLSTWYSIRANQTPTTADTQILNSLQDLSGRDFEIAYMRAMLNHLSEAVTLSQAVAQKAPHPQLKTTASNMAKAHSNQVQQLRTWLSSWYGIQY